jgi:hypothetical protein
VCISNYFESRERDTDVVCTSVSQDIIKGVSHRDVLGRLTDDDGKFNLVVREMFFDWLCNLGDVNRCVGTDDGCEGFVEQDGRSEYSRGVHAR